jgi:transmembrane sensor
MNDPLPIVALFVKYLQDECSAAELEQLFRYFDVVKNETVLRALIRAELDLTHPGEITDSKEDAALSRVRSALLVELKERLAQQPNKRQVSIPGWLKLCAVWLVLAGALGLVLDHFYAGYVQPVKLMTAVTGSGERKLLTLSDGTKIWLSPSSALEYPDQLTGNLREVKLEGEAFFEVAKDKRHPFVIHSGRMDTRVVGTSFDIRAFRSQANYTVTVVTGIVKVSAVGLPGGKQKMVTLKPDEQSRFDRKDGSLAAMAWPGAKEMLKRKDGILDYDGAPVEEVIGDLCRYYNLHIVLESTSKNCLCYGEFDTNGPVKVVLAQLAAAINATVVFEKDKYLLKGGCGE